MEKSTIERSIWIDAPRERVWKAITDPAHIEQWFSPGTQWHGTGLEVGGKIFVYNPETATEMYTQIIEVVDPPHQLVTRSAPEPPAIPEVTTWTLEEENGGTRLTLSYTGYEALPADVRRQRLEQDGIGFTMVLENVKAQVEERALPYPQGF